MKRTIVGRPKRKKLFLRLFLFFWMAISPASATWEKNEEQTWIDEWYKTISKDVVDWSRKLDTAIADRLSDKEKGSAKIRADQRRTDIFFQTRKYLEETVHTYIRLRLTLELHTKESDRADVKARLHIPLPRTQRHLKLFFEGLRKNENRTGPDTSAEGIEKQKNAWGVDYFSNASGEIHIKSSVGMMGLHPYTKVRMDRPFQYGIWHFDPVMILQYSARNHFEEETTLYCDYPTDESSLFRIELYRGTKRTEPGMYYGTGLSYDEQIDDRSGIRFYQLLQGHTDYRYTPDDSATERKRSGIHRYVTALSYRRNVWRRWLFVEVRPALDFSCEHHYRPDYGIYFYLDLFFGNY